ncbi:MAG: GAF domain-containing protein [Kofleriaceae bacterium]
MGKKEEKERLRKAAKEARARAQKANADWYALLERKAELSDGDRLHRLDELSKGPVSDEELQLIISAPPPSLVAKTKRHIRRELTIRWHQIVRAWSFEHPVKRLIYAVAYLWLPVKAALRLGFGLHEIIAAGILIVAKGRKVLMDFDPDHIKAIRRNYSERKLQLVSLLHTVQQWKLVEPNDREVLKFQTDALVLIASYIRDHRSDVKGKKLFANLLVKDGIEHVKVIARADNNRPIGQRYTRDECTLVWGAFESRSAQMTGNLQEAIPSTPLDKKYKSILTLPIIFRDEVVGVVSIDSEEKYHFDGYFEELPTHLGPYVQLLASSLQKRS